ncbi:MAG: ABC transporter permease [Pseudobdellovibrionaceae bacterium]
MIAFLTLLHREISRFLKVIVQTILTPLVSSFLYLLVFGVSLGGPTVRGVAYLAFLIPGLMMMGLINNAFQNASSSIVTSKFSGDLEDWKVAPISHHQIIWALGLGSVVRGTLVAMITWLVGSVFFYIEQGVFLWIKHPFIFIYFILLSGLIFGFLGVSAAFWAKTFDQLSALSSFVLLPLTYLGGVFISIDHLSAFWQKVSLLNPLLYLINGLRFSVLGQSDVALMPSMLMGLVGTLIFYILALFSLRRGSYQRW